MKLRTLVIICVAPLLGLVPALGAPPADQTFESISATEGSNNSASLTVSGVVYSTNGSGTVETYGAASFWGVTFTGHSGKAVIANFSGSMSTSITYLRVSSANSADKFRLNSLVALANEIESSYSYAVKYKVEGYSGATLIAQVAEIDLRTSGTYGSGNAAITYTRAGSLATGMGNGGTLAFGSAWNDIDTVIFTVTDGKAAQLSLDSIDFSSPTDTTAPTIASITRITPAAQRINGNTTAVTFRVTYSESVQGVSTADFSIEAVNGGSVTGTIANVSGTGSTRDVTVTLTGGSGELRLKPVLASPEI